MRPDFRRTEFVRSAAAPAGFLRDLPQAALAGRSNAGKSSVLNCLAGRRNLARTGQTPGRTALVNYFRVDGALYLADLPGYGYARVSREERGRWARLMEAFFADPANLRLGVLVVDARHAPSRDDAVMAAWFRDTGCPLAVCANKTDALAPRERPGVPERIREALDLGPETPVIPFSARTGAGREELAQAILSGLGC